MHPDRSYLDHNATSPLRPEARAAMLEAMELVGNPSSVHAEGRAAKALMERARWQVASLCGAKPEQVAFTSGGTEANAMALARDGFELLEFDETGEDIAALFAISTIEHDSLRSLGRYSGDVCNELVYLPVDARCQVDVRDLVHGIEGPLARDLTDYEFEPGERFLATVMAANNEVGVVQPIIDLAQQVQEMNGTFHTDAVQIVGKLPFSFAVSTVQLASVSAHKFGGPKGVGALIVNNPDRILPDPLITGGGQEKGMRAGTENLVGIAGFGAAAEAAERDLDDFGGLSDWRDELEVAVAKQTSDAVVIAQKSPRLPNTSCIALPGVPAETLVMALDLEGVAVSSGSACSSGKVTRSHVLEAMGLPDELTGSAIRISLGWNSSKKDVDHFVKAWAKVTDRLTRTKSAS